MFSHMVTLNLAPVPPSAAPSMLVGSIHIESALSELTGKMATVESRDITSSVMNTKAEVFSLETLNFYT